MWEVLSRPISPQVTATICLNSISRPRGKILRYHVARPTISSLGGFHMAQRLAQTDDDPSYTPDASSQLLHFPPPSPVLPSQVPTHTPQASSTSLQNPPSEPPRPRLASSNPDAMVLDAPYSLLDDMRQSQQQHGGAKERVALYSFPSFLSTNIRRVLSRNASHRADWGVALSCLVWRGVQRYNTLPAVQALSTALLALDTDDALEALAGEQIEMWRRGFKFSIPDPTHTMGLERCRAFKAPEYIHADLHDLAGRIGLAGSTLGIVCVMAALHDQDGVLGEHGRHMGETVAELDGLLEARGKRLQGLIRAIEAGVWR
jgi:hypothetical protein